MSKVLFKDLEAIIFDLDGTLWSTVDCCVRTLANIKNRHKDITKDINEDTVIKCMGYTFDEIVDEYYGYLDYSKAVIYTKEALDENVGNLLKYGGNLYPDLEITIKNLSKKYKLFIVSNCVEGYIESFLKRNDLVDYFDDYECNGKTKLEKGQNIKLIMDRNNIKNAIYVGDTIKDKDAADFSHIPFIYASYGFGNIDVYDYKLDKFSDLNKIL